MAKGKREAPSTPWDSRKRTKLIPLLMVLVLAITAVSTMAFFTDRVTDGMTFTTATFSKDGYTLKSEHPDGPFIANEDVKVTLKESSVEATESVITMSVKWTSPDPNCKIFGHATATDNATITIGGQAIAITSDMISADKSTVTFNLPAHALPAGTTDKARDLLIHIPNSLMGTGQISVTVDTVALQQQPNGFSTEIGAAELTEHNFTVDVGWAASALSANNGKNLMGYLVAGDAADEYKIQFKFEFKCTSSAMKDFASRTDARWSAYKDSVTDLLFIEGMTSIGDYAFPDFSKVEAVSFPTTVADIGISAFDNSGLSDEVTIPATVKNIESLAFGNLEAVNEFTFGHTTNDLTLPANRTPNSTNGAFYVSTHVDTTVNTTVEEIQYGYGWHDGWDNRRLVPMLSAQDSWQYYLDDSDTRQYYFDNEKLTSVEFKDYFAPADPSAYTIWDASDPSVPGTVTAYLSADGTELTFAGNGYSVIFANPDSSYAFSTDITNAYEPLCYVQSFTGTDLLDTRRVEDMSYMFFLFGAWLEEDQSLSMDVNSWNVSNVKHTDSMFEGAASVTTIDLSKNTRTAKDGTGSYEAWNPTSLETASYMFDGYQAGTSMETIDITGWAEDIPLTNTERMFGCCYYLKEIIGLDGLNMDNVTNATQMFAEDSVLESLVNIDSWTPKTLETTEMMFQNCDLLESLDISHWKMANVTNTDEMFANNANLESIVLPADLKVIGTCFASACPKLDTITFNQPAGMDVEFPEAGLVTKIIFGKEKTLVNGAFYINTNDPLDPDEYVPTKVITNNEDVLAYNWTADWRGYTITISDVIGGTVTANPVAAINGKTVTLSPAEDSNYAYDGATVTYTDEDGANQTINLAASTTSFVMPAADVTVTPKFVYTVTLDRIAVTKAPDTTVYDEGSAFDRTGMVVTAYFTDGSEKVIDNYTIADESPLARTQSELAISYTEGNVTRETTQAIRVYALITIDATNRTDYGYDANASTLVIPEPFEKEGVWYKIVSIGQSAFSNCTNLESVTIPDTVTSIGAYAFEYCTALTGLEIPASVTDIAHAVFRESGLVRIVIPDTVTTINTANMFNGCASLTEAVLPSNLTAINNYAFYKCTALTDVNIPETVTSIGTNVFQYCSALTEIDIPGLVKSIGKWAFNSTAITSVEIPDSVTSLGTDAFSSCESLVSAKFGTGLKTIPANCFENCTSLTEITWPANVTSIGSSAFRNCAMKSLVIPDTVTTLSSSAFWGCASLESAKIGSGISQIPQYAFRNCSALQSVSIHESVSSIRSNAFQNCTNLAHVYYSGTATQWAAITIDSSGNTTLKNATKHYQEW